MEKNSNNNQCISDHTHIHAHTFDVVIWLNKSIYFIIWMLFNQMLIFITLTAIDVNNDDDNEDTDDVVVIRILPIGEVHLFRFCFIQFTQFFNQKTAIEQ